MTDGDSVIEAFDHHRRPQRWAARPGTVTETTNSGKSQLPTAQPSKQVAGPEIHSSAPDTRLSWSLYVVLREFFLDR